MGLELPSTLTFDYPTIDAIAEYINSIIIISPPAEATDTLTAAQATQPIPATVQTDQSMHSMASTSLAVVTGAASRSVKNAISSMHGIDVITPVPLSHWDVEKTHGSVGSNGSSQMAARFGGFLEQLDMFDGGLFGLSANEAQLMDPQQRMLLELTYQVSFEAEHMQRPLPLLFACFQAEHMQQPVPLLLECFQCNVHFDGLGPDPECKCLDMGSVRFAGRNPTHAELHLT